METHTFTDISMPYLLNFVFNKLSEDEMDKFELFLHENDLYASIVDDLIKLVNEQDLNLEEAIIYLKQNNSNDAQLLVKLKLVSLAKKFQQFKKQSIIEFEKAVKQWFTPNPPAEYKVALMSDALAVITPIEKQNYTTEIAFTLNRTVDENDKVFLSIFETDNEVPKIETKLNQGESSITINIDENQLHPGIYYWRMQSLQTGAKAEGEFYINHQLNPFK